MSEYYCYGGHLMPVGKLECPQCGSAIASGDGMGRRELEDAENYREEEEEEDSE